MKHDAIHMVSFRLNMIKENAYDRRTKKKDWESSDVSLYRNPCAADHRPDFDRGGRKGVDIDLPHCDSYLFGYLLGNIRCPFCDLAERF